MKSICTLILISLSVVPISSERDAVKVSSASEQLRAMYFNLNFDSGEIEGKPLLQKFPQSSEVTAWHILNMAANASLKKALVAAEKMTKTRPNDPWSWFALAGVLSHTSDRGEEALAASQKALAKAPKHPDFMWLRAETLKNQSKFQEAIDFIEKNYASVKDPQQLMVVRAEALYLSGAGARPDTAKTSAALEAFAEIRRLDKTNVLAHVLPGQFLVFARRTPEGYPLLKKALELSPNSNRVHRLYWQAVAGLPELSAEQKQAEIEADIKSLLERRSGFPATLSTVRAQYELLKVSEKKRQIEEKILQEFPQSKEAEWVFVHRYREFRKEAGPQGFSDPAKTNMYRAMLREFINRPMHHDDALLGDAYRNLFIDLNDDPSASTAEIIEAARGMTRFCVANPETIFPSAAIALADRGAHFQEAEAMARQGFSKVRQKLAARRAAFETQGEYVLVLNRLTGMVWHGLGWVHFKEGRYAEAEKTLLQAYELAPQHTPLLHHLGQFYQFRKDLDKAEGFYIKGALVETLGTNPNHNALKALYELRNGGLNGYEEYVRKLKEIDTTKRREKIFALRIKDPRPATPFILKTVTGEKLSLEDLKGKVSVINFWGMWCGPCVKELPDIQKLHERYKDDSMVAIVTIDNDPDPAVLKQWLAKNNYNFTTLLDNGYVEKVGIRSFPTTWFIDEQGRIAFTKVGWSEKLLEEFVWRIEDLRQMAARQ
ncbi:MAG TPA: redoxin domain-containing protein [Pyrinomonadaceae bacterium]|nr:redoxin domain-containing protein [Pyrinomonadaceae bacterium]